MATTKTEDWKARSVGYAGLKKGTDQKVSLVHWGRQVLSETCPGEEFTIEVYAEVGKQMLRLEAEMMGKRTREILCRTLHWDDTVTEKTYFVIGANDKEWYKAASLHFEVEFGMKPGQMMQMIGSH